MTTKPEKPADETRPRLGRGLAALMGGVDAQPRAQPQNLSLFPSRGTKKVPIEYLSANPRNPRHTFGEVELDELAASIREKGILQPLLVRPLVGQADRFEIIAGERRWRAAQRAGLHDVPVHVVEADDREALEFAIIENVQRADLNPLEEASGYERLLDEFNYSQVELAKVVGKSRSHVANSLRLLKLPERVKGLLREGEISAGHARALLNAEDPQALAEAIVAKGLSVRQAEAQQVVKGKEKAPPKIHAAVAKETQPKSADTKALEKTLAEVLGMDVTVMQGQGEAGKLTIHYRTFDQLDFVTGRLRGG
ncbi:MAG TPA: ParB/RepB/Spo0J family partition protein [Methylocella sp.]|nr:ParB/RepB/Spo0J family partition protein [Methylocella sp.]